MDLLTFCTKYLDYADRFDRKTYLEKRLLVRRFLSHSEIDPNTPTGAVDPDSILSYLESSRKERGTNAFNKDRKNLLAMWNWGGDILGLQINPVARIKRIGHDRTPQFCPQTEDVLKVLMAANQEERTLLFCYLLTGTRKSEIFRWTWNDDINFERRESRLGTRKTRDGSMEFAWFPMSDFLYDLLWKWWSSRPIKDNSFVFVSTSNRHYGRPFTARRQFMKSLCRRAVVRAFGFQALRRYFASIMADNMKVSAKTIQRLLSHANVHTTERYIKHLNQDLEAVLDGVAEHFPSELLPHLLPKEKEASKKIG